MKTSELLRLALARIRAKQNDYVCLAIIDACHDSHENPWPIAALFSEMFDDQSWYSRHYHTTACQAVRIEALNLAILTAERVEK